LNGRTSRRQLLPHGRGALRGIPCRLGVPRGGCSLDDVLDHRSKSHRATPWSCPKLEHLRVFIRAPERAHRDGIVPVLAGDSKTAGARAGTA
jgi:hypothetical protein